VSLGKFIVQWNNHGLRTEGGKTPQQLFVTHSLQLFNSTLLSMRELFHNSGFTDDNTRRVDTSANVSSDINTPQQHNVQQPSVAVPTVSCPVTPEQLIVLKQLINSPDISTDASGVKEFLATVAFIESLVV
jgi:hypothetical protein